MTNNEMELVDLVRNHSNPTQAILIAIDTITSFLRQLESSQAPNAVALQERA